MRNTLVLALLLPTAVLAAPATLHQQGRLLDSAGQALAGPHDLTFALYDAPSSGTALWTEATSAVNFDNGFFNLVLGLGETINPSVFANQDEIWVSISVDGGAELTPRAPLNSVPWALSATSADVAHSLTAGQTLDVAAIQINGTTVLDASGLTASASWSDLTGVPTDLSDGDADTLASLSCAEGQVAAFASSAWTCTTPFADSDAVAAIATADTYLPRNEAYTDSDAVAAVAADDSLLPRAEAYTDDDAIAAVTEAGDLSFAGLTELTGGLSTEDHFGTNNWVQFTTDKITNSSTTGTTSVKVADIRCSGHWGSYAVDIELYTYYYRPAVRHYTYYCGNGNHSGGGVLTEKSSMNSGFISGDNAVLRKANVVNTGLVHSGQTVFNIELWVDNPAYVQSYMRVTSYGPWRSFPAGTTIGDTETKGVWHQWNQ